MRNITVEQLGAHEAMRLKEIRLRALKDSPDAFYYTYEVESEYSPERWLESVKNQDRAWFVATQDGTDVGLVGGRIEDNGDGHLFSMWIAPEARGRKLASLLVDVVIDWTRERGATRLNLWAVDDNTAARALYRGKGFLPTGQTALMRDVLPESEYFLSFLFRTATLADLPAIVALIADDAIAADRTGSYGEAHLHAFEAIEADPNNELVVAEIDGRVVGTAQLTYIPGVSRNGATRLLVEAVRIAQDLRGHGLGRRLMEWCHAKGRDRGCALVQLTSDKAREDAHRFYRALGYAQSHEGFKLPLD
ncbi:GNAT family N-acetyltransferase [Nonomuraea sp. NPDC050328]|uniref:GNAT family N-acetyltransferase n=1 Tax=Nonomuraea sp. NPDC050328 TaxID=3364361 RepID=UPI0037A5D024